MEVFVEQPRLHRVCKLLYLIMKNYFLACLIHLKSKTSLLFIIYIVSVLGRDKRYKVKYNPLPEGVPENEARGSSWRQRDIFDRISQDETRDIRSNITLCLKEFLRMKPKGTPEGKGIYLTVYPKSSPSTDIISF